jgi:hypothetical protein
MIKEDFTTEATSLCLIVSGIAAILIALVKSTQFDIKSRVDTSIKCGIIARFAAIDDPHTEMFLYLFFLYSLDATILVFWYNNNNNNNKEKNIRNSLEAVVLSYAPRFLVNLAII